MIFMADVTEARLPPVVVALLGRSWQPARPAPPTPAASCSTAARDRKQEESRCRC